jgi:hypothetical protein
MRVSQRTIVSFFLAAVAAGCALQPAPPTPGTAQVWGEIRLVPRSDLPPPSPGGAYGDRRMRGVKLFDYSKPGFAVVYADAGDAPGGELVVTIRSSPVGTVIEPRQAALGASGRLTVRNASEQAHVISSPEAGVLTRLAPRGELTLDVTKPGEQRLFVLDAPSSAATVFVAPGPFDVVSASGRFVLTDLPPGPRTVHAWHPRLPAASRSVELHPDESLQIDLELGVGLDPAPLEDHGDARD